MQTTNYNQWFNHVLHQWYNMKLIDNYSNHVPAIIWSTNALLSMKWHQKLIYDHLPTNNNGHVINWYEMCDNMVSTKSIWHDIISTSWWDMKLMWKKLCLDLNGNHKSEIIFIHYVVTKYNMIMNIIWLSGMIEHWPHQQALAF